MSVAGEIIARLGLDISQHKAQLASARRMTEAELAQMERSARRTKLKFPAPRFEKAEGTGSRLGGAIEQIESGGSLAGGGVLGGVRMLASGAVGTVAALAGIAYGLKKAADAADDLADSADQIGVTTDLLQNWRDVARPWGLDVEKADRALAKFNAQLDDARKGSGPAYEAFKRLGIGLADENGTFKSLAQLLPEVASGIQKLGDRTAQAAMTADFFGEKAVKLVSALSDGGFAGALKKAAAVDQRDIAALGDLSDALGEVWQGLKNIGMAAAGKTVVTAQGVMDLVRGRGLLYSENQRDEKRRQAMKEEIAARAAASEKAKTEAAAAKEKAARDFDITRSKSDDAFRDVMSESANGDPETKALRARLLLPGLRKQLDEVTAQINGASGKARGGDADAVKELTELERQRLDIARDLKAAERDIGALQKDQAKDLAREQGQSQSAAAEQAKRIQAAGHEAADAWGDAISSLADGAEDKVESIEAKMRALRDQIAATSDPVERLGLEREAAGLAKEQATAKLDAERTAARRRLERDAEARDRAYDRAGRNLDAQESAVSARWGDSPLARSMIAQIRAQRAALEDRRAEERARSQGSIDEQVEAQVAPLRRQLQAEIEETRRSLGIPAVAVSGGVPSVTSTASAAAGMQQTASVAPASPDTRQADDIRGVLARIDANLDRLVNT